MSDTMFSAAELTRLREIAGTMIPGSSALGMPGADDPAIFDDIVRSLGRDAALVRGAIAAITERAAALGIAFADVEIDRREALVTDYHRSGGAAATALARALLGPYYRDDRVLQALGHEARAPFPKGHVLEQGDWSLLEPVRRRPAFWRDDRASTPGER